MHHKRLYKSKHTPELLKRFFWITFAAYLRPVCLLLASHTSPHAPLYIMTQQQHEQEQRPAEGPDDVVLGMELCLGLREIGLAETIME
jgi:hypothetical protein